MEDHGSEGLVIEMIDDDYTCTGCGKHCIIYSHYDSDDKSSWAHVLSQCCNEKVTNIRGDIVQIQDIYSED